MNSNKLIKVIGVFLLLTILFSLNTYANPIKNPGFELGLTGWNISGPWTIDSGRSYNGTNSTYYFTSGDSRTLSILINNTHIIDIDTNGIEEWNYEEVDISLYAGSENAVLTVQVVNNNLTQNINLSSFGGPTILSIWTSFYSNRVYVDNLDIHAATITLSGDGSSGNPYQITNCPELQQIRYNMTAFYELSNFINCNGFSFPDNHGFKPIGTNGKPFKGVIDGKHFGIDMLYINRTNEEYVGLFGFVDDATIKDIDIVNSFIRGRAKTGTLAGYSNNTVIVNVYIEGIVNSTYMGPIMRATGGLIGYAENSTINFGEVNITIDTLDNAGGLIGETGTGTIINSSYSTGKIIATQNTIGGLVGTNLGDIFESYSFVNIIGSFGGTNQVGGLVGYHFSGSIIDSFARGNVTGYDYVAGFIGYIFSGYIDKCYSTGYVSGMTTGGFIGGIGGTVNVLNSYWDNQTSGKPYSANGVGRSTFEMKQKATYTNWNMSLFPDNVSIWIINQGFDYPILQWDLNNFTINISNGSMNCPFSGTGSGTAADPFNIGTCVELQQMRCNMTAYYELINHIECGGFFYDVNGFLPIGNVSTPFQGEFEGNNFEISNLYTDRNSYSGVFGHIKNAKIKNVNIYNISQRHTTNYGGFIGYCDNSKIDNITVKSGFYDGNDYTGAIIGYSNLCNLYNSSANATITGNNYIGNLIGYSIGSNIDHSKVIGVINGVGHVAGLIGYATNTNITKSIAYTTITATGSNVGGLIGAFYSGIIKESASFGTAVGLGSVGGLIGVGNTNPQIINSYSQTNVSALDYVGGLIGQTSTGSITNSYSTGSVSGSTMVGGLIGFKGITATVTSSYYNSETSGQSDAVKGTPKTTAEMFTISTYSGWNISNFFNNNSIWFISETKDYPRFGWEPFLKMNETNMSNTTNVSCGDVITKNIKLQDDLVCSNSAGLVINSDSDITIDCNHHKIIGDLNETGIFIDFSNNITIVNCTLINWTYGIKSYLSTYINVVKNDIFNNTVGIDLLESNNVNVLKNRINDNIQNITGPAMGIHLDQTHNSIISDNQIKNNGKWYDVFYSQGILITESNNNQIINNNITFNDDAGIRMECSAYTSFNNTVSYNNFFGNLVFGIDNLCSDDIEAKDNFWGTVNLAIIENMTYDYNDNPSMGIVNYCPYLNGVWPGGVSKSCQSPDTTPPNITIINPQSIVYNQNWVNVNVSFGEKIHTVIYELDYVKKGTITNIYGVNTTLTELPEGHHRLVIFANDTNGNYAFKVVYYDTDTIAPIIKLISPQNKTIFGNNTIIDFRILDFSPIAANYTVFNPNEKFKSGTLHGPEFDINTTSWPDNYYNITVDAIAASQKTTKQYSFRKISVFEALTNSTRDEISIYTNEIKSFKSNITQTNDTSKNKTQTTLNLTGKMLTAQVNLTRLNQTLANIIANGSINESKKVELINQIKDDIRRIQATTPIELILTKETINLSVTLNTSEINNTFKVKMNGTSLTPINKNYEIKTDAKVALITYLDGTSENVTVITRKMVSNVSLGNIELIEFINKSILINASDSSKVIFYGNYIIVKEDPIVKWNFANVDSGDEVEAEYSLSGDVETDGATDTVIGNGDSASSNNNPAQGSSHKSKSTTTTEISTETQNEITNPAENPAIPSQSNPENPNTELNEQKNQQQNQKIAPIKFGNQAQVTIQIKPQMKQSFKIGNSDHTVSLDKIISETSIKVTIQSDPISLILEKGKSRIIDVDNDGVDDLEITLESADQKTGIVDLLIKRLNDLVSDGSELTNVNQSANGNDQDVNDNTEDINLKKVNQLTGMATSGSNLLISKTPLIGIAIIIVIVAIGAGIGFFIRKKK